MAETLLVMRDGYGNRNSNSMFFFSIWGRPRIPRVKEYGRLM